MYVAKVILVLFVAACLEAKVFKRCELAKELKNKYKIPHDELSKWICLTKHESNFNTKAVNEKTGDHGIFQISQLYWCSPPGKGKGCDKPCKDFENDNIDDDVACAKKIKEKQGFTAWVGYNKHCTGKTDDYLKGCKL